jgi:hypothetical protein
MSRQMSLVSTFSPSRLRWISLISRLRIGQSGSSRFGLVLSCSGMGNRVLPMLASATS